MSILRHLKIARLEKNSVTAACCYLCPDCGSRGSEVLICCCFDDSLNMEFLHRMLL
ncbi:hypothetical protein Fmac_015571 [Flemingia macrophylla]|uniref:Uncharacterized protein n=1 Tax=Flemingia macrophylla TaxID=520843 RepID=A0ABD1MEY0_9FABA